MIKIKIHTALVPEQLEKLEDLIRDLLEGEDIKATIDDTTTGNRTQTRNGRRCPCCNSLDTYFSDLKNMMRCNYCGRYFE